MAVKSEIEKMTNTAQEIAENQRASYEKAADDFMAFQRRSMSFAEDGLKLMEMGQGNFKAAQKWWADGFRLAQHQQDTVRFAGEWMSGGFDAVQKQTEQNMRAFEEISKNASRQQENVQTFADAWMNSYRDFFAPFMEQAEKNVKAMKSTNGSGR